MTTINFILVLVVVCISLVLGYQVGISRLHKSNRDYHEIKVKFRAIIFSRQNWTSKELYNNLLNIINSISKAKTS